MTSRILSSLSVCGFRGFSTPGVLELAVPNGAPGSGMTILLGQNNSGKSTLIEAIRAMVQNHDVSFTQGRRNLAAGDTISIILTLENKETFELRSVARGNSETIRTEGTHARLQHIMVVPSRRHFAPFFNRSEADRTTYMMQAGFPATRDVGGGNFNYRLFTAQKSRAAFDAVMARLIDPAPDWVIDQHDTGHYFLKFAVGPGFHSSEGLGDGIISLLFIVDALYDSKPGDVVVLDEPELSLHPQLLRKLSTLLVEYAATRQIVISTHSPYFVNFDAIASGAVVSRVYKDAGASRVSQLSNDSRSKLRGLLTNANNPHILGLDACEAFFLNDGVILLEGQEDVVFYSRVAESLGAKLAGNVYGWGVGGAGNIATLCTILRDLGFRRVVGVVDYDKHGMLGDLRREFPAYSFEAIPAPDVRTKPARPASPAVQGLLDDGNRFVRPEYQAAMRDIVDRINTYVGAA
jgi:predicted ATPase